MVTNFGDIRSAVHNNSEDELKLALLHYDGDVSPQGVVDYIKKAWGWCPATSWDGKLMKDATSAMAAYSPACLALSDFRTSDLVARALGVEILRLDNASKHIEGALAPLRIDMLDRNWMPLHNLHLGSSAMSKATQILYYVSRIRLDIPRARELAFDAIYGVSDKYKRQKANAMSAVIYVTEPIPGDAYSDPNIDRYLLGGSEWKMVRSTSSGK